GAREPRSHLRRDAVGVRARRAGGASRHSRRVLHPRPRRWITRARGLDARWPRSGSPRGDCSRPLPLSRALRARDERAVGPAHPDALAGDCRVWAMHARLTMLLHAGAPIQHLWESWVWSPAIVLPLLAAAVLYARGLRALW